MKTSIGSHTFAGTAIRVILCLAAFTRYGYSQIDWQKLNTPVGGAYLSVVCNSKGDLFAVNRSNGYVIRSTNNGAVWSTYAVTAAVLAIDPNENVYAGSGSGSSISTDNGETWTAFGNTELWHVSAFAFNATGDIFIGRTSASYIDQHGTHLYPGGIFKSTYKGSNWTSFKSGEIQSLAVNSKGYIFGGTTTGLLISKDNGTTWTSPQIAELKDSIVFSVNRDVNDHIWAVTNSGGLFKSTDDGDSWTKTTASIPFSYSEYAFIVLIITPNGNIFAGTPLGIFHSTDKGDSWSVVNTGLPQPTILTITSNASGAVFAGTDGFGMIRSTDNGSTWLQIGFNSSNIKALASGTSGSIYAGFSPGGIYRSIDNGISWSAIGLTNYSVTGIIVIPADHVFAFTSNGFFHSSNLGNTWNAVNDQVTDNGNPIGKYTLVVSNTGDFFAGTVGYGVYRSTDYGATWVQLNNGIPDGTSRFVHSFAFDATGGVYAGTSDGLFYSTDNCNSWTKISLPNSECTGVWINSNGTLFGNSRGLFRSTD